MLVDVRWKLNASRIPRYMYIYIRLSLHKRLNVGTLVDLTYLVIRHSVLFSIFGLEFYAEIEEHENNHRI